MKLCYIWTEDYKGFKNQRFNHGTDYIFNSSKSNLILTQTVEEKHIKNYFGNEITDIVGIIGMNTSGKTNILDLIQYVYVGANTIIDKAFLLFSHNNNKFITFNYKISQIQNDFGAELRNYDEKISTVNSIFFSNVFGIHKFLVELQELDVRNQRTSGFKAYIGSYANRRVQFTLDYNDRVGSFQIDYFYAVTNQSSSYCVEW